MNLKIIISIAVYFFTFNSNGQEPKSDAGGPPELSEIIGYWKMVDFPQRAKMNKIDDPWPQPYQYFAFYEDHTVCSMMTTVDGNYSSQELDQVFKAFPKNASPTFQYNGKFIKIVNPAEGANIEMWGANLFAKDIGKTIKKGDLMLTLDDGTHQGNKSIIYYRLLRKIQ